MVVMSIWTVRGFFRGREAEDVDEMSVLDSRSDGIPLREARVLSLAWLERF